MAHDSQLKPRGQHGIPTERDLVGTIKGGGPEITTRINIVEGGAAIVLIGGQGGAQGLPQQPQKSLKRNVGTVRCG
jgi:hypothetical protein